MKAFSFALAAVVFTTRLLAVETPLSIDKSHSHIEAVVMSSLENFTVKLTAYDTVVWVDLAEKRINTARLSFRFADLKTGKEERDSAMVRWQETDQFPECAYILEALLPAVGGTYKAKGKFILHGVTKTIINPVTVSFSGAGTCMIDGDLSLDTTDFGLPTIRKYVLFTVNPVLHINFHLEGHAPTGP
jgi:polyisoprenoid-binding protein YceI